MPFIKHGDGKIMTVVETDELTEEQKKAAKKLADTTVKQSKHTDDSVNQNSGSN